MPARCWMAWLPLSRAWIRSAPLCRDSFSVGALQLASDASPQGQSGCKGKGGLKKADMDAAGLSRDLLECAWQNHDGERRSEPGQAAQGWAGQRARCQRTRPRLALRSGTARGGSHIRCCGAGRAPAPARACPGTPPTTCKYSPQPAAAPHQPVSPARTFHVHIHPSACPCLPQRSWRASRHPGARPGRSMGSAPRPSRQLPTWRWACSWTGGTRWWVLHCTVLHLQGAACQLRSCGCCHCHHH